MILAPEHILYSRHVSDKKLWFIERGTVEELSDKFANGTLRKVISLYD